MRVVLLISLLATLPVVCSAGTYKCEKPDGKVTFQDQPCQAGSTGKQIVVRPTAPSADPAEIEKMKTATSKAKPQQAPTPHDSSRAKNGQIEAYNRSVRCNNARANLGALKSQRPVFRYDNKGERQYVEDSNRQGELAAAERAVAESCN